MKKKILELIYDYTSSMKKSPTCIYLGFLDYIDILNIGLENFYWGSTEAGERRETVLGLFIYRVDAERYIKVG